MSSDARSASARVSGKKFEPKRIGGGVSKRTQGRRRTMSTIELEVLRRTVWVPAVSTALCTAPFADANDGGKNDRRGIPCTELPSLK
jgi:hypothetical protein